ncbi:hypothetical protein VTI74DRAFT_916 [Chaetomium olivicolor]
MVSLSWLGCRSRLNWNLCPSWLSQRPKNRSSDFLPFYGQDWWNRISPGYLLSYVSFSLVSALHFFFPTFPLQKKTPPCTKVIVAHRRTRARAVNERSGKPGFLIRLLIISSVFFYLLGRGKTRWETVHHEDLGYVLYDTDHEGTETARIAITRG